MEKSSISGETDNAMAQDIDVTPHLWIGLPDGRRLAATLWRPRSAAAVPAILEYLPYRRGDGTAARDATTHPLFAAAGYACLRVDLNGSGDSDGLFDDEYSPTELADGEAVIAWLRAQPWCNGRIGMIGISWGGFNGLQLAYRQPPGLDAVVSCCSTVDRYADDIHFMGGCLLTDNFNWGAQMTAYMTRPPDPAIRQDWRARWLERIDRLPFSAARWLEHPWRDGFWQHGSVCEDFSRLRAAILAIGGWADAYLNAPDALASHSRASALIGPWEHKYPHLAKINPADFHGEVLGWFDRHLKDQAGPAEWPAMRAFIQRFDPPSAEARQRRGHWVAYRAWPSPGITPKTLNLRPGELTEAPGSGSVAVRSPSHLGLAAAYFCPGMRIGGELAGDQAVDDAMSVCFDSPPLADDLEILGRPRIEFGFTSDKPVAQLCFRLCEVDPAGRSLRISYRPFNLNHHGGHAAARALRSGERYRARVALNMCGHRLSAGHRLRLAISTSYWPVVWPAPECATVTLELADCQLTLPQCRLVEQDTPFAPVPPRPFPLLDAIARRQPASHTERRVDAQGRHVLATFDDFGAFRHGGHGLEVGSHVRQHFGIAPDDPLSALHQVSWHYDFRRDDWSVTVDSHSQMTSTGATFVLEREVVAREAGGEVRRRQWHEELPRGWL